MPPGPAIRGRPCICSTRRSRCATSHALKYRRRGCGPGPEHRQGLEFKEPISPVPRGSVWPLRSKLLARSMLSSGAAAGRTWSATAVSARSVRLLCSSIFLVSQPLHGRLSINPFSLRSDLVNALRCPSTVTAGNCVAVFSGVDAVACSTCARTSKLAASSNAAAPSRRLGLRRAISNEQAAGGDIRCRLRGNRRRSLNTDRSIPIASPDTEDICGPPCSRRV